MISLITGGSGFIGSHLTEKLLSRGDKVIILDDLSTGRKENISTYENLEFHQGSVLNEALLNELTRKSDRVFHLAAAVGVHYVVENPLQTLITNIRGTENVLNAAALGAKKVFIASTSEVYGKNEAIPFTEDGDMVLGATRISRWGYACSKALDEHLSFAYFRERELPVVIGRFFNTCGPRQVGRYGMVLPRFIKQALCGVPLTVYGDGNQTRCFSDVEDILEFLVRLMEIDEATGQVFNMGSQERISMNDLAAKVINVIGSASGIEHISYEEAFSNGYEDMMHRVPNISKVKKATGYSPKVSLEQTIERMVKFFQSNPEVE